jgi:hypothetical protein
MDDVSGERRPIYYFGCVLEKCIVISASIVRSRRIYPPARHTHSDDWQQTNRSSPVNRARFPREGKAFLRFRCVKKKWLLLIAVTIRQPPIIRRKSINYWRLANGDLLLKNLRAHMRNRVAPFGRPNCADCTHLEHIGCCRNQASDGYARRREYAGLLPRP